MIYPLKFPKHFRTLFDCLLILTLLLILGTRDQAAQAKLGQSTLANAEPIAEWPVDISANPISLSTERTLSSQDQVTLDNPTIAAMFAAENAALTLPQHVLGLPLVRH